MNKAELAKKLAHRSGLTQALSGELVEIIFKPVMGIVADELDAGGKVSIAGFGVFETRERSARTGRNPRTGEAIEIAAKRYPAFKAAKPLKDRLS